MGEKLSKDYNVANEYRALPGMPYIGDHDFDVELEKQCFMSVNVIRQNPRKFIPHFQHVMDTHGMYHGKNGKQFIKWLEKLPKDYTLPPLALDADVMKACKLNNDELKSITDDKMIPKDGNRKKLALLTQSSLSTEAVEFTYWSTWDRTPHELVLLNILIDYDRHNKSIILGEMSIRCGFGYAGHPKFGNVFQSVFVVQKSNNMM